MDTAAQQVDTVLLSKNLKIEEEARRVLEKEPSRIWPAAFALVLPTVQLLFSAQIAEFTGLPTKASWFVVLTVSCIVFLSAEVGILRRQVKALYFLQRHDV